MLLSVRDAASLLACSERQIYRWVDDGEIPFRRVLDQVRFNRTDLLEWATVRRVPVALEAFDTDVDPEDRAPSLEAALRLGGVHHDVPATDRDAVLRAVVERTPVPASLDRDFLVEVLIARENTGCTAVADGIAIPHVRHPVVAPGASPTVSVAYLRSPVAFGPIGDEPVKVVVFIVSPTIGGHLRMLAHVARAILDPGFRAALDRFAPTEALAAEARRLERSPPASAKAGVEPA